MDDKEKEKLKRRVEAIQAQRKVQPINSRIEVNDPRKRPHGPERKSDSVELTAQAIQKGAGLVRSGALKAGSGLLSGIKKGVKAVQDRNESKAAAADVEAPRADITEDAIPVAEPSTGPLLEQTSAHVSLQCASNVMTQQERPDDDALSQDPSAEELELRRIAELEKEEEQLSEEVAVQEKKIAINKMVIDRDIAKLKKSAKEQKVRSGRTHYIYVCTALLVVCAGSFYGWKHFNISKSDAASPIAPSPIAAPADPQHQIAEAISDALGETETPVVEATVEVAEPAQQKETTPSVLAVDQLVKPEVADQPPEKANIAAPKIAGRKERPAKKATATPGPAHPENKWQEKASDDLDRWSNSIK
ncbi:hypothetical protein [Stenotrophomonas rhizophila]|uniref:Uncharacterized protein n=1 Tax=Stenotrophomonas rhizophila TaxID=216778 RepID=A0A7V7YDR3_9GAMM|nr:hypothetical protein [Stenotrophomonas rhizophila]KAB7628916.1 hypothetical protein F9K92_15845 [Stenotrophomonas rhizophila]